MQFYYNHPVVTYFSSQIGGSNKKRFFKGFAELPITQDLTRETNSNNFFMTSAKLKFDSKLETADMFK